MPLSIVCCAWGIFFMAAPGKQRSLFDCGVAKVGSASESAAYKPIRLDPSVARQQLDRKAAEAGDREMAAINRWYQNKAARRHGTI